MVLPSPKSQVMVWVSNIPGSVKLPLKLAVLPSSRVRLLPAFTVGARLLTFTVNVSSVEAPAVSLTVRVTV